MPQPDYVSALGEVPREELPEDIQSVFARCEEKLGFVPNVLRAYTLDAGKLRAFRTMYNDLMLGDSSLSPLEREMIAVVVSAVNRCYYCLVAHGAAVRELSGDPELGEMLTKNYRTAKLSPRQQAMLDFAHKLTESPDKIEEADRLALSDAGFDKTAVFHIASVAGFFNMSNRVAVAIDMIPNREYHHIARKTKP